MWLGWRAAFAVHALLGTGFGFVCWRGLTESKLAIDPLALQPRRVRKTYREVLAQPEFRAYACLSR